MADRSSKPSSDPLAVKQPSASALPEIKSPRLIPPSPPEKDSVLSHGRRESTELRPTAPRSTLQVSQSDDDEDDSDESQDNRASTSDEEGVSSSNAESSGEEHPAKLRPKSRESGTDSTPSPRHSKSRNRRSGEVDLEDEFSTSGKSKKSKSKNRKSIESTTSTDEDGSGLERSSSDFLIDLEGHSKRSLRKLLRASLTLDDVPMPPAPPPLPAGAANTLNDDQLEGSLVEGGSDSLLDVEEEMDVPSKAGRILNSAASKKNMLRRKSLAMMDKLLSKGSGAGNMMAGPKAVRYSSNFFAQFETFASSPVLQEDPLAFIYTVPEDDIRVVKEPRDEVQPFPIEEKAILHKLGEAAHLNPSWLLEGYKLFTHDTYRVVQWKYADMGGPANRVADSTAPGTFTYRVVPKGYESDTDSKDTTKTPSNSHLYPAHGIGVTSTFGGGSASGIQTSPSGSLISIPITIKEDSDEESTKPSTSGTSLPGSSNLSSSPSSSSIQIPKLSLLGTSSESLTGTQATGDSSTPRGGMSKKEARLSASSGVLTASGPVPSGSSSTSTSPAPSMKRAARKRRSATASVNLKDLSTTIQLSPLTPDHLKREQELRQMSSKVHLFNYYSVRDKNLGINEMPDFSRSHVPHPFEFVGFPQKTHTSIEATGISLPELPSEEPVFCTLSLHDVAAGLKVSEDFCFELSSLNSLAALDRSMAVAHGGVLATAQNAKTPAFAATTSGYVPQPPSAHNMGNRCLVTITGEVHANYYLILKISRLLLSDDVQKSVFSSGSSKRDSVQAHSLTPSSLPSFYKIPYCFGAVPLGTSPSTLPTVITNLLPCKNTATFEELYDLILNEKEMKKLKTVPGSLSLHCSRVLVHDNTEVQARLLNPQLEPFFRVAPAAVPLTPPAPSVKKDKKKSKDKVHKDKKASVPRTTGFQQASFEVSKETGRSSVIKALQELGPQNRDFYLSNINHLYVLPKRFTLKGGSSKDVQVEIRFKDSDHSPNHTDAGLPVFFGGSHCPKLMDVVVSNVCRSDKHVEFTEEFKLKLPYVLGPQHHLLFTLYELDTKRMKRSLLGYSVLPLLGADHQLGVTDTVQALVVHPELGNHYMMTLQQQALAESAAVMTAASKSASTKTASLASDMKKRTFLVSTTLVSSVYTMNPILSRFFFSYKRFPKVGDTTYDSLLDALANLPNVENNTIFKHFPLIFNLLISIICSSVPSSSNPDAVEPESSAGGARSTSPQGASKSLKSMKKAFDAAAAAATTPPTGPQAHLVKQMDTVLGREAFVALLDLIAKVNATTPGKFSIYLRAYLSYMFDNSFFVEDPFGTSSIEKQAQTPQLRALPFEAIVNQINALHQSGNNYFSGFEHGWFLLGLIVKSMALHLSDAKLFSAPRLERFTVDYTSKLQAMLLTLLSEKNMRAGIDYTQGTALFLKDMLGLIDRGAVLTILHDYLVMTRRGKSGPILETYKFALLKIVGNYEHLSSLNLPLAPSGKELESAELLGAYLAKLRERHPIAGELVHEISTHYIDSATASTLNGAVSPNAMPKQQPLIRAGTILGSIPAPQLLLELRNQSIICLRHVLAKHELDPRFQNSKVQQRIASMYFNYIVRVSSDPSIMAEMPKGEREDWLICFMYITRNVKRRLLLRWLSMENQKVQVNFWSIVESSLSAFDKLTLSRQADLLAIDLITSVLSEQGAEWNMFASGATAGDHTQTNPVLKKVVLLLQQLVTKAMTGMTTRGPPSSSISPSNSTSSIGSSGHTPQSSIGSSTNLQKTLLTASSRPPPLRPPSVSNAAGLPVQDEAAMNNLFLPMQILIERCPLAFFANTSTPGELFGLLLYDFLSQGNHLLSMTVRSFGASMLYLLLQQARNIMGTDFAKVKVDMAVAASKLIGTSSNSTRRIFAPLMTSLEVVKKCAQEHQAVMSKESAAAGHLSKPWLPVFEESLNHIIKLFEDSSKLEMNMKDPEMMQELYISIEKSFSGSPELRVTWMENLSQLHSDNEDYEEAAECRIQIASMVAQFMRSKEGAFGGPMSRNLPPDWHHFPFVAPSLKDSNTENPVRVSQANIESSTWHSKYLLDMLRQAAVLFDKATRYELALEVYNNMRMYHKMEKKWDAYSNVIREEQELLARLVDVKKPIERAFPFYFRVAFYGSKWEHLDGKQFIYKKSAKFSLSNFKKQIEDQYRSRMNAKAALLGEETGESSPRDGTSSSDKDGGAAVGGVRDRSGTAVEASVTSEANTGLTSLTYNNTEAPTDLVIMSTNEPVARETLDPTKCYVQMTGVQPYFESEEADSRVTRADQHFALNQFVFETAYAEDTGGTGKETEDLSKQCKKKIIFKTTHCFPYLKTRLEIVSTKEVLLNPIENAIESIKQQIVKLRGELDQFPTRLKSLQQVIQGSVVPMVNPGPLKICEIFLSEKMFHSKKYSNKDLKTLCNAMNQFVKLCAFAIKLNKANIDASHAKFQAMVEQFHGELEKIVKACTSQVEKLLESV